MSQEVQASEIPAKIFKQNTGSFVDYICMFCKKCIDQGNYPFLRKHASIMLVFNESCRGFVDNLKTTVQANINILLNNLCLTINVDFVKDSMHNSLLGMLEK